MSEAERTPISGHLDRCESCRRRAETLSGAAPLSRRPTLELVSTAAPLERGTGVGRYVILHLLGAGAMGFVYEAVDPEPERKVALELLRTSGLASLRRSRSRAPRPAAPPVAE